MLLRISGIEESKTIQFKKYITYFEKGSNINPLCNIEMPADNVTMKVVKNKAAGVEYNCVILIFESLGEKDMHILMSSDFYDIQIV